MTLLRIKPSKNGASIYDGQGKNLLPSEVDSIALHFTYKDLYIGRLDFARLFSSVSLREERQHEIDNYIPLTLLGARNLT